jgi:hypothetical protein
MIFQVLLTFMLALIGVYYAAYRGFYRHRIIVLALLVCGVYFVWNPPQTTVIANLIGVGRGLDLALPVFCLILLFFIVAMYRKIVGLHDQLTSLARHIALNDVMKPDDAGAKNELNSHPTKR